MDRPLRLLIVGAGPFGLALAARARRIGIDHRILGHPMGFWKNHMPPGMRLRSGCDWHLDPGGELTIERYLSEAGRTPADAEPLDLDLYLSYAEWFRHRAQIEVEPEHVARMEHDEGASVFLADLDGGSRIAAENVALAPGFRHFEHVPPELESVLPDGRWAHTCDAVDLEALSGRRVLIVGGRQSAFEWAWLLREAGARHVDVVHRHPTPRFEASDWSWVDPLMERTVDDPGWFRRLDEDARERLDRKFWEEGRLKLEPWLASVTDGDRIALWPNRSVVACEPDGSDGFRARLDGGETLEADHAILATGYRVDLERLPWLRSLCDRIDLRDGFPRLDTTMQTSLPGLYITSMPATRDFGSFFAFTVSVRAAARIIGRAICEAGASPATPTRSTGSPGASP